MKVIYTLTICLLAALAFCGCNKLKPIAVESGSLHYYSMSRADTSGRFYVGDNLALAIHNGPDSIRAYITRPRVLQENPGSGSGFPSVALIVTIFAIGVIIFFIRWIFHL